MARGGRGVNGGAAAVDPVPRRRKLFNYVLLDLVQEVQDVSGLVYKENLFNYVLLDLVQEVQDVSGLVYKENVQSEALPYSSSPRGGISDLLAI
ncbi:hypothetical protein UY3_07461 [Chelonia mydas]|uniref:Uncharacterized protein n=1 Tax=Chelonia mydas TaxID=8469 RepID=M7C4S4_CHEMY|nr:hypothetical protein UY3_07461 [Chelonia mydas]